MAVLPDRSFGKKDRVKMRQDVLERSRHGIETPVRMGEVIGHA